MEIKPKDENKSLAELQAELEVQLVIKQEIERQLQPVIAEISKIKIDIDNIKRKETFPKICKIIDKLFEPYDDEECNIIILNAVNAEGRYLYEYDCWGCFDILNNISNKYVKSITDIDETLLEQFLNSASDYIPSSEEIFENHSGINQCWFGIVALTKDRTIVSFICREDGLMATSYADNLKIEVDFNVK